MKKMTFDEMSDKWDAGEFTHCDEAQEIVDLEGGKKIGDIMSKMTVCPVGNATCVLYMKLEIYGYNPDKAGEKTYISICPLGVEGDGEKCPLNK